MLGLTPPEQVELIPDISDNILDKIVNNAYNRCAEKILKKADEKGIPLINRGSVN